MTSDALAPLIALACFLLAALLSTLGSARLLLDSTSPLGEATRILCGTAGPWLAAAGAALLVGSLAARGLQAGAWPLTSHYEFALAFALSTPLAALALGARPGTRSSSSQAAVIAMASLLAAGLIIFARLLLPGVQRAIRPLPPALDSIWLPLHAGTAALAYGPLAVAGMAGMIWLTRNRDRSDASQLLHRSLAVGFPLLTLSLIFGMIWAQVTWGDYWSWDLKEVWTLITWLICALYWHLHRRPSWQGRRVAWLALTGLGAVLFTFLGTGWLARTVGLQSLHLF